MKFQTLCLVAIVASVATLASNIVLAGLPESEKNDAVAQLAAARITLSEAIAVAENHVQGKATSAELETEEGRALVEVEVVDGRGAVYDVTVDAVTGEVLTSQVDPVDQEQDEDEEHDD